MKHSKYHYFSVTGKSNAFEISQITKYPNEITSITFCAPSKEIRDQWIETIDNNIKQSIKIQNQVFSNIICFFKILKYLDIYDILQCARVSKSWFTLLFNNESKQIYKFWRGIAIRENYLGKHHKSNRYDDFYSTTFYRTFCLDMKFINIPFCDALSKISEKVDNTKLDLIGGFLTLNKEILSRPGLEKSAPKFILRCSFFSEQLDESWETKDWLGIEPNLTMVDIHSRLHYQIPISIIRFVWKRDVGIRQNAAVFFFPLNISEDKTNWIENILLPKVKDWFTKSTEYSKILIGVGSNEILYGKDDNSISPRDIQEYFLSNFALEYAELSFEDPFTGWQDLFNLLLIKCAKGDLGKPRLNHPACSIL